MIRTNEVFKIGYISKHRGLQGEVEMIFTDDCFDTGNAEYLVLDMDGIFVPFFWEEYKFKNDETAIIKFEDIDTEKQARKLVGHSVFYPKSCLPDLDGVDSSVLSSYKALTGFEVSDESGSFLGTITHVDDSSANILLSLKMKNGKEIMIPFHNDFLLDFNLRERTLRMELPEGLLQLFI